MVQLLYATELFHPKPAMMYLRQQSLSPELKQQGLGSLANFGNNIYGNIL